MLVMKFFLTWLDNHVVHMHFQCFAYLIFKGCVHHSLMRDPDILQAEWHDTILVVFLFDHKGNFSSVRLIHWYLVITRVCVHEGHKFVSDNHLVYLCLEMKLESCNPCIVFTVAFAFSGNRSIVSVICINYRDPCSAGYMPSWNLFGASRGEKHRKVDFGS